MSNESSIACKKRWQDNQTSLGLCIYCTRKAAPDRKLCQFHIERKRITANRWNRANKSIYYKQLRQIDKEIGNCYVCHKPKDSLKAACANCREKWRAAREKRKANKGK